MPSAIDLPPIDMFPDLDFDDGGLPPELIAEIQERAGELSLRTGYSLPMAAISPEMILAMARARLNDLDNQIAGSLERLQNNTETSEVLTRQQEALNTILAQAQKVGTAEDTLVNLEHVMIEVDLPGGGTEMVNAHVVLNATGHPGIPANDDGKINIGQINSTIQAVKQQSTRVNSSNEMLMMTIQTLTQQRTQVIQMSTNLITKLNEGMSGVVGNLGR